jgi:hypothetical protein|tara:strand:- start:478 stop:648 length:171 start_codon:yes stop_codon:yes gene_type:complete
MISNQEWEKYVNTGKISLRAIQEIVSGLKRGAPLNGRQLAIYMSNSDMIETLLKLK